MDCRKFLYTAALGVGLSATINVGVTQADTLRFAVGFPSGAPIEAAKKYAESVKENTNNEHSVKIYELSLLNHSEMSSGISQGMADLGYLLTAYSPSDYPHSNLGADMSMQTALQDDVLGREGYAYSGAMLEYIMLNCPECQNEFSSNNQVYTSVVSTPAYVMFCNEPVKSAEDLKGKRMRISGAPWARWVKDFGGSPVALPVTEVYEALEQGVVDCTFLSPTELTNFNLIDVVKNITTDVPGGLYAAGGAATLNRDTWNRFNDEEKEAMLKAGSVMAAYVTFLYQEQAHSDMEKARSKGINIIEADSDLLERSREFIKSDLEFIPEFYSGEYGIDSKRTRELADTMSSLIKKWNGLVGDIETADQLAELYWSEVYSKLEPSSYGK